MPPPSPWSCGWVNSTCHIGDESCPYVAKLYSHRPVSAAHEQGQTVIESVCRPSGPNLVASSSLVWPPCPCCGLHSCVTGLSWLLSPPRVGGWCSRLGHTGSGATSGQHTWHTEHTPHTPLIKLHFLSAKPPGCGTLCSCTDQLAAPAEGCHDLTRHVMTSLCLRCTSPSVHCVQRHC